MDVRRWLRDRADSYWKDADRFAEDGDAEWAAAYRAIADELRKCANEIPQEVTS